MGLLASSKSKQSRDLRDCLADDSHHHYNNGVIGGFGGGRVRKRSGDRNPVRLLRSRTLSSEESDAVIRDTGKGATSPRVSNVSRQSGGGPTELIRLLGDTQPVQRWQEPLRDLLASFIMPRDAQRALAFLAQNMNSAYRAVKDPSHSLGYPAIYIDVQHKPTIFEVDLWKRIVLALHFEITEPEGSRQIDLIELTVTKNMSLEILAGFRDFLHSLSDVSWNMLQMVLKLDPKSARRCLSVIQDVLEGRQPCDHQILQELSTRYPDQFSALGFNSSGRRHKEIKWQMPSPPDVIYQIEVILIGLYHDGSGLETYI